VSSSKEIVFGTFDCMELVTDVVATAHCNRTWRMPTGQQLGKWSVVRDCRDKRMQHEKENGFKKRMLNNLSVSVRLHVIPVERTAFVVWHGAGFVDPPALP